MHRTGSHPPDYACPQFHIDDVLLVPQRVLSRKQNQKIVSVPGPELSNWACVHPPPLPCIVLVLALVSVWLSLFCQLHLFLSALLFLVSLLFLFFCCSSKEVGSAGSWMTNGNGHFANWLHSYPLDAYKVLALPLATICRFVSNQFCWLPNGKLELRSPLELNWLDHNIDWDWTG